MVSQAKVKQQLKSIKADFQFLGHAELRELPHILFEDENLHHVVFGHYAAGFAILCATNQRVLLVDKKPFYLTVEDIRYDMISDMVFNHRLLDTSVTLGTVHKSITFVSFNQHRLRDMTTFVQKQVMDSRRQQNMQQPWEQPQEGLFNTYESPTPNNGVAVSSHPAMMSAYRNPIVIRRRASKFFIP